MKYSVFRCFYFLSPKLSVQQRFCLYSKHKAMIYIFVNYLFKIIFLNISNITRPFNFLDLLKTFIVLDGSVKLKFF